MFASALVAPAVAGLAGALGVWGARANVESAPEIVAGSLLAALAAVMLRQRGVALAALGVGVAAAFASPAGLGPLLVATGVIVATQPSAVDRRLARWPDVVDGLVALPALAGLASVVAAQPSARGVVLGAGAGVLTVASWWRGPRHGIAAADRETVVSYLGAAAALMMAFAPALFGVLGVMPEATEDTGRGMASAAGVVALVLVVGQIRRLGTKQKHAAFRTRKPRREVSLPPASS